MYTASPVGHKPVIRSDSWGEGHFGAGRGDKIHDGVDLVVTPGQPIFSMISGMVEKEEQPYFSDPRWKGIQIANAQIRVEIWYMMPDVDLKGRFVQAGQPVGVAQDISLKYPPVKDGTPMMSHIHVRMTLRAFTTINEKRWVSYEQYVDPTLLLGV